MEESLPRSRPELPEPLVQALALRAALGSVSMVAKKHAGQQGPEEPSLELGLRTCGPALHDRLERPLEDATKWATVLHRHELVGGDALAKRCDQVDPVQQLPGRASLGGLGGSKGGPATVREGWPRGTGGRSRGANLSELVRAKQAQT